MTTRLPEKVIIETTNDCNMRCRGCYHDIGEARGHENMSLPQFAGIVEKIQAFEPHFKPLITPFRHGEPTINPRFLGIVGFLIDRDYPFCFSTNGKVYDDTITRTLASGNRVLFSLDGFAQEVQEYWREHGDRGDSVRRALKERDIMGSGEVAITYLRQGQDWDDVMNFVSTWIERGVDVVILRRWLSSEPALPNPTHVPCRYWSGGTRRAAFMVIRVDGSVLLCDTNIHAPVIGNIYTDSMAELTSHQGHHEVCDGCQQRYNGDSMKGLVYVHGISPLHWKQDYYNQMFTTDPEQIK